MSLHGIKLSFLKLLRVILTVNIDGIMRVFICNKYPPAYSFRVYLFISLSM